MIELRRYLTEDGRDVFGGWLKNLRDRGARARSETRLTRVSLGNFGDCKPVGSGVRELKIDIGPGYRAYSASETKTLVLLRCGGDKRTQTRDIARAIGYWNAYQQGTK